MIYCHKSNTLAINSWENLGYLKTLEIIDNLKIKNLILDYSKECNPLLLHEDFNSARSFFDELKSRELETTFILGVYDKNCYSSLPYSSPPTSKHFRIDEDADFIKGLECNSKYPNIYVEYFPYYWLVKTYRGGKEAPYNKSVDKWREKVKSSTPKTLGYIFVNRPREHRSIFIDLLHRKFKDPPHLGSYSLDQDIQFTWNILTITETGYKYPFKHWKEEITIDPKDTYGKTEITTNWDLPSDNYFNSLFEIVLESSRNVIFMTEKTWKPIVYGKPFLIFGAQFFHAKLKDIGFKLFDSIIDYEFDTEPDEEKRATMMLLELKKLKYLNYQDLLDEMQPELDYNKKFAEDLITSIWGNGFYSDSFNKIETNARTHMEICSGIA